MALSNAWKMLRILELCTLGLSFASWVLQIAGVASLQAACKADLQLVNNDVDSLTANLGSLHQLYATLNPVGTSTPPLIIKMVVGSVLQALTQLAHRSATSVFVLTPDQNCRAFYRYQWLTAALQLLVLLVALAALASGRGLRNARMALTPLMAIVTVLSIENAHTLLNTRYTVPERTLTRGMVFFYGCVLTAAFNLLLTILLGFDGPSEAGGASQAPLSSIATHGKHLDPEGPQSNAPGSYQTSYQTENSS